MQAKFKGLLKKVDCQTPTTKLTIEVNTDKTKLDEIKELLEKDIDILFSDNQTTLAVEYTISENKNSENKSLTITAKGAERLGEAKELLEK